MLTFNEQKYILEQLSNRLNYLDGIIDDPTTSENYILLYLREYHKLTKLSFQLNNILEEITSIIKQNTI